VKSYTKMNAMRSEPIVHDTLVCCSGCANPSPPITHMSAVMTAIPLR
jgi:hypothetical protein